MRSTGFRVALVVSAVIVGACAVPTDESAQVIDPEQLPESLRPDFTTTTSTTVAPTPVTEPATLYLLWLPPDTERRLVVEVTREVSRDASMMTLLSTLFGSEMRTEEEQEAGYANALFELELLDATVENGVAIIDIVPLTPEGEPSEEAFTGDLIGAAAQLVFSATELEGVDGVRILINGEGVPIPTNNPDTQPGDILDRSDYERFDPDIEEVIPTTTTVTDPEEIPSTTEPAA